ncbi:MAG: thioredoxin [Candidatus Bathyarchaeota archaeon]|nr:thioredoxin [Candidatus Bathyarchaeota archaeon]
MDEEDDELRRIRQRKIEDMMRRTYGRHEITDKPVEVTDLNFSEVIKGNRLVVIDFWASWCAPCRMMAPIIDELAKEYSGKILFGKLNVDENTRKPAEYGVMSIPTFLVFRDGVLVDRFVGAMPKKILEQKLAKYLEP